MQHYFFNDELVPNHAQPLLKELLDGKNFQHSPRLLGASKGRGTTWFLNTQAELGLNCVLRHYYRGGLFGKVVKDHYWFSGVENTRAYQEFQLLNTMRRQGLPVPRPLGLKIQRTAFCYQADILLEKLENCRDLSQILQQKTLSQAQYQQIGQLIAQLHQHQVHHSDLNIHNILFNEQQGEWWLIDFDKCRIQAGNEWKPANLARLKRSFEKEQQRLGIQFHENDWSAILSGYRG